MRVPNGNVVNDATTRGRRSAMRTAVIATIEAGKVPSWCRPTADGRDTSKYSMDTKSKAVIAPKQNQTNAGNRRIVANRADNHDKPQSRTI
mmetsp:Transcript_161486/g.518538  ORF Transcript_161486/g.518538 Transcript_161486/m.518538 type:complete len:91 (-) Transcript_161486:12-284(-)